MDHKLQKIPCTTHRFCTTVHRGAWCICTICTTTPLGVVQWCIAATVQKRDF